MAHLSKSMMGGMVLTLLVSGCGPKIAPMAPIFGPGSTEILLIVLIGVVGYIIWNKLAATNKKLDSLEQEIKNIKEKMEGANHN